MQKIIWLTGHSNSGKSTLAFRLQREFGYIVLDGDEMRKSISLDEGFSIEDRKKHNLRVARLAKVLSAQNTVVVSVIAPLKDVRAEIDDVCHPTWIYLKRTLPEREGHFYEEPENYFTLDQDKNDVNTSYAELKIFLGLDNEIYSLFIGRYQPLHEGHIKLIESVLNEGKKVAVGLRATPIEENNPYSVNERIDMFKEHFGDKVLVFRLPDISEVCYGRKVGWGIREIRLDSNIEEISATKIRNAPKETRSGVR